VIKRGEYGAVLFTPTTTFAAPALILDTVIDPTGAGDAFAGGMLGYLASIGKYDDESMRQALVMGIIMASFAVEDFSTARFDTIDADLIKTRIKQFEDLTRFEMPQPKIRID
ncbi:sugar kinase, partial [Myxococcota bacterium]|nr:sugar kinase [Myxococcota bacterium]